MDNSSNESGPVSGDKRRTGDTVALLKTTIALTGNNLIDVRDEIGFNSSRLYLFNIYV